MSGKKQYSGWRQFPSGTKSLHEASLTICRFSFSTGRPRVREIIFRSAEIPGFTLTKGNSGTRPGTRPFRLLASCSTYALKVYHLYKKARSANCKCPHHQLLVLCFYIASSTLAETYNIPKKTPFHSKHEVLRRSPCAFCNCSRCSYPWRHHQWERLYRSIFREEIINWELFLLLGWGTGRVLVKRYVPQLRFRANQSK
jgi:hypothetical protein